MFIKLNNNYINLDNIKGCKFFTDDEDKLRKFKVYFVDGTAKRFTVDKDTEEIIDLFLIPGDGDNNEDS